MILESVTVLWLESPWPYSAQYLHGVKKARSCRAAFVRDAASICAQRVDRLMNEARLRYTSAAMIKPSGRTWHKNSRLASERGGHCGVPLAWILPPFWPTRAPQADEQEVLLLTVSTAVSLADASS